MFRVLSVAVVLSFAAPAAAEIRINEKTVYYDIAGSTPEALVAEMESRVPTSPFGRSGYFAFTTWRVEWYYSLAHDGRACRLEDTRVSVDITYTMPRWLDRAGARRRLINYWDEFEQSLWTHERGHGDIGVEVAREVDAALGRFGARATCEALQQDANARASAVIENSTRDRDYDARTGHGRTQGAYFDISAAKRGR